MGAILNTGFDLGGKLSAVPSTTARTNLVEQAALGRFEFERWQIKDLSFVSGWFARHLAQLPTAQLLQVAAPCSTTWSDVGVD